MSKLYKLFSLAAIVVLMSSCEKFLDINSNPAVPQDAKAEFLLAPITYQMANGTSQDYRVISKLTQALTGSVNETGSTNWEKHGFMTSSDVGGVIWRMTYVDLGLNLENMIKDGIQNKKYEYAAIGYAIKAWAYQQCTDLHGPIILDEAFTIGMFSFPYHDQPEVYKKVREWGDLSLKYMNMKSSLDQTGKLNSVTGDNIYRGDMIKWKKFIYALYALQYSHLINKPEFITHYADSVIKYTDLSFAGAADDATIFFSATASGDTNPYGANTGLLTSTFYSRPSINIVSYLTGRTRGDTLIRDTSKYLDPRLKKMLVATPASGLYEGSVPTKGVATGVVPVMGFVTPGTSILPGHYLFTDNARYPLMSYAQLQFAKAEALFWQNKKDEAFEAYKNGIRGHFDFVNMYGRTSTNIVPALTNNEYKNYMESTEVAQNSADLKLSDIMGQKYIAQWGWATLEQWTDIRKYHYNPAVFRNYYQLSGSEIFSNNNGKYAYRFRPRYNSEYIWNAKELDKWGGLAKDYMTKELWFSQP